MAERQRRMISCDLTGEEDEDFLAWVAERQRRNKLSHEIREGLWLRYTLAKQGMGRGPLVLSQGLGPGQMEAVGLGEQAVSASPAGIPRGAAMPPAEPANSPDPTVPVDPAAAERLRGRTGALLSRFGS